VSLNALRIVTTNGGDATVQSNLRLTFLYASSREEAERAALDEYRVQYPAHEGWGTHTVVAREVPAAVEGEGVDGHRPGLEKAK
jgi:hypothetical protein